MKTSIKILLAVLLTIFILAIIFFFVATFLLIAEEDKFFDAVNKSYENFCNSITEFNYGKDVIDPNYDGVLYSGTASYFLLAVSYATAYQNCSNLKIPNPPGYTTETELKMPNDSIIYGAIYTSYGTGSVDTIIAFSGTLFVSQWLENFKYQLISPTGLNNYTGGIQCHTGFYEIYMGIRPIIQSYMNKYQGQIKTLYTTGHSLGAALSSLCSFDLYDPKEFYKLINYNFASPRVGNNDYASFFDKNITTSFRVNNTEDLITDLPPAQIGPNIYCHTYRNVPFTVSLSNLEQDHTIAYAKNMPLAFESTSVLP